MSDIVERLRGAETCRESGRPCRAMEARSGCCCAAAADEIERLRAALAAIVEDQDKHAEHLRVILDQEPEEFPSVQRARELLAHQQSLLRADVAAMDPGPCVEIGKKP